MVFWRWVFQGLPWFSFSVVCICFCSCGDMPCHVMILSMGCVLSRVICIDRVLCWVFFVLIWML